jgi:hypothetical protein
VLTRHAIASQAGEDREPFPIASTPLGQINALAVALTDLSVPRGMLDQTPADSPATFGYLRNYLMLSTNPDEIKDRVWRHVGETARVPGPRQADWNVFALGLGYPGLRKRARQIAPSPTAFKLVRLVHYELAIEFLLALHRLSLDTPHIPARVLGAAYDQASRRKAPRRAPDIDIAALTEAELHEAFERTRAHPYTGPDDERDVLNRLVKRCNSPGHPGPTLSEQQAALIARTYLDGEMLYDVAAEFGLSGNNASKRRIRGAAIVATLLGRPQLADP